MPKKSTNQILPDTSELTGLPPLVGDHSEILILGTFPGCCSLCKGEYYADRGNSFRKIMADILNKGIPFKTYAEFETCLKKNNVALWDVYKTCQRDGSSDKNIQYGQPNTLETFLGNHQGIGLIIFNGTNAQKEFKKYFKSLNGKKDMQTALSTSGANAKTYDVKLENRKVKLNLTNINQVQ